MNLSGVVQQLKKERDQAARVVESLEAVLAALNGSSYRKTIGTHRMSVAGRARISAAQKARWAKLRRNGGKRDTVVSMPKRTMSAAARRKIAAAQKGRWRKVKAGQKH